MLGKVGITLCLLGSLQVVVNAPEDPAVLTADMIIEYSLKPGFLTYLVLSVFIIVAFIMFFEPIYGKKNPVVYLTICSLAGSFTVVASKGLGISIRLTLEGNNQFKSISTYVFLMTVAGCIVLQLNYFNKALASFSSNVVTPTYYVFFTTATIAANMLLFQGFSGTPASLISILSGFFTLFIGVFLLNNNNNCIKEKVGSDQHNNSYSMLELNSENARVRRSLVFEYPASSTDSEGKASLDDMGHSIYNKTSISTGKLSEDSLRDSLDNSKPPSKVYRRLTFEYEVDPLNSDFTTPTSKTSFSEK
ncbi:putative magnesium transporter NIPA1 [Zancudomyces culisetae]|uniref:Putative magnesium transporter NIPA1 n=1 Tax=Zancudomyces culisetae TaxID=1213189 RepID=A0A1R1PL96_ZANCU|nr:putative magnesium transporter NIPA1 [Zancudomyces culisetae]OMH84207.1 putative magnesium transporter NIPA1 [Zancudomyces culisetae]|eukprot:OMH81703.1 putative magnesium transporter NIPA1 [Zancudomyces culisetae]